MQLQYMHCNGCFSDCFELYNYKEVGSFQHPDFNVIIYDLLTR